MFKMATSGILNTSISIALNLHRVLCEHNHMSPLNICSYINFSNRLFCLLKMDADMSKITSPAS